MSKELVAETDRTNDGERGDNTFADFLRDEVYTAQSSQTDTPSAAGADRTNSGDKAVPQMELTDSSIKPGDLEDPAKLAKILTDAKAAHEAFEEKEGKESPWSDFYAKYINDKLKEGGQEPLDEAATEKLKKVFEDAGKAHHQFEIDTGEEDKDWPGWYANYIIQARKEQ